MQASQNPNPRTTKQQNVEKQKRKHSQYIPYKNSTTLKIAGKTAGQEKHTDLMFP